MQQRIAHDCWRITHGLQGNPGNVIASHLGDD